MSVSTDAILFYGVCLAENVTEEWEGEAFCELMDLDQTPGIEIVMHQSLSCPLYGIAIAGTITTAGRGYPQEIDPAKLNAPVLPSGRDPIDEELRRLGVSENVRRWAGQNTKWWMVSWWEE